MQSYTEIPSSQSLQSSLALLLNNDKTALSCSSGSAFPNTNLQVGMLCLRTDQAKLYQLKNLTPTWVMIADLNSAAVGNLATTGTNDLNSITTSGFYRVEIPSANGAGSNYGQLLVIHGGGDTITQIYGDPSTGNLMTRSGNPSSIGGAGNWSAWRKLWHDGNDGAGSGLDADLLDGMASGNASGNIPISNGTLNTNLNADMVDGKHVGNGTGQIPLSNGTVNTDLNADTLDGYHASSFVRTIQGVAPDASGNVVVDLASKVSKSGDTMTGDLTIYRAATPTTGVVFLGNSGARYLYYDGTNYNMPGANLILNGGTVWHSGNIGTPLNGVYGCLGRSGNSVGLAAVHGGFSFNVSAPGSITAGTVTVDAYGRATGYTAPQNCNCCS